MFVLVTSLFFDILNISFLNRSNFDFSIVYLFDNLLWVHFINSASD